MYHELNEFIRNYGNETLYLREMQALPFLHVWGRVRRLLHKEPELKTYNYYH